MAINLLVMAGIALIAGIGMACAETPPPLKKEEEDQNTGPKNIYFSKAFASTSCAVPPVDLFLSRDQQNIFGQCEKVIGRDSEGFPKTKRLFFSCGLKSQSCTEKTFSDEGLNHPDNAGIDLGGSSPLKHFRRPNTLEISPGILASLFHRYIGRESSQAGITLFHANTGEEKTILLPIVDIANQGFQDQQGKPISKFDGMIPVSFAFKESTQELFVMTRTFYDNGEDDGGPSTPGVLFRYKMNSEENLEYVSHQIIKHSYAAANMILAGPNQDQLFILNEWTNFEATLKRNEDGSIYLDGSGNTQEGERLLLVRFQVNETSVDHPQIITPHEKAKRLLAFQEGTIFKALPDGRILIGDENPFPPILLYVMDPQKNPNEMFSLEPMEIPGYVTGVEVKDNLLYATNLGGSTFVFDITDVNAPKRLDQSAIVLRPDCAVDLKMLSSLDPLETCLGEAGLNLITPDGSLIIGLSGFLARHPLNPNGFDGSPDFVNGL